VAAAVTAKPKKLKTREAVEKCVASKGKEVAKKKAERGRQEFVKEQSMGSRSTARWDGSRSIFASKNVLLFLFTRMEWSYKSASTPVPKIGKQIKNENPLVPQSPKRKILQ
jgi:hypothetical protein